MSLSTQQLEEAYAEMLRIRGFEERAQELYAKLHFKGSTHLGIGQEAVAVGTRLGLQDGDLVAPTYRGHAYALAWGMTSFSLFAELLGREAGSNHGRGGSKHMGSAELGVIPGNAIVAANLPIACGTALRAKMDGDDEVTVVVFGDGATNQAAFHEAMNLAAVWDLPVIFLCENNLYSEMTPIKDAVKVDELSIRASAYGMPGVRVDGMSVGAVADVVSQAASRARAGQGPTFIEAMTYRYCGHMPGDLCDYRTREEEAEWKSRDAIEACEALLIAAGKTPAETAAIRAQVEADLNAAEAEALASPLPDPSTINRGAAAWMETSR
ncbi:MAG: thiamine pyrophosphate-dependent dehydrogenase E1 component subunit alpha [Candidatus Nanopelagicales bacterium]|nr:thiamine pyrophosphate-dependent dehydrogenase E1 component subunit alpha [Candidatus Nanopelagicales bacterium]